MLRPKIDILDFTSAVLNIDLYPEQAVVLKEIWTFKYNFAVMALGRRSGKTLLAQISAVYAGLVMDPIYQQYLRRNERFRVVMVANSEDQAGIAMAGIQQIILDSPFSGLVDRKRDFFMRLSNGVEFIAMPTSARAARGLPAPLIIQDELAFTVGGTEVNAGGEAIYKALSPSMAQFGEYGLLLALSSPGLQQGIFWKLYEQSIALRNDGEKEFPTVYGIRKPSWEMNPRLSQAFLDAERKRDPELFDVEYGANFITNAQGLVDGRIIDDSVDYIREFGKPDPRYFGQYYVSLDPAKGNRDDYTVNIAHWEGGHLVVDLWHKFEATKRVLKQTSKGAQEVSQVDVKQVQAWIKTMHNRWGFSIATMDQYSSMETIQSLQDHLDIREFIWSSATIKKAYSRMRELFNAGLVVLPPDQIGIQQLKNLTVIHRASGQWTVTGGSKAAVDDYCAAFAANVLMMESPETDTEWLDGLLGGSVRAA